LIVPNCRIGIFSHAGAGLALHGKIYPARGGRFLNISNLELVDLSRSETALFLPKKQETGYALD
jgi:hypothetical protein